MKKKIIKKRLSLFFIILSTLCINAKSISSNYIFHKSLNRSNLFQFIADDKFHNLSNIGVSKDAIPIVIFSNSDILKVQIEEDATIPNVNISKNDFKGLLPNNEPFFLENNLRGFISDSTFISRNRAIQILEKPKDKVINPTNSKVKVIVSASQIDARDDTFDVISAGSSTQSVLLNDFLNGNRPFAGIASGNVTLTSTTEPSGLTLNSDGTIKVSSLTPSNSYSLVYKICEVGAALPNCDSATATVVVLNPIDANYDVPVYVSAGVLIPSVIINDSFNNSKPIIGNSPGNVILTPISLPSGFTLNSDGTIKVDLLTPSKTYTIDYQICEFGSFPSNCDIASAKVVVFNKIVAVKDDPIALPAGGLSSSLVLNFTINNAPAILGVKPGNVSIISLDVPAGLTLNPDATIKANPLIQSGTYTVDYQICEIGSEPLNCDFLVSTTVVVLNPIDAVRDAALVSAGSSTPSVIINDILNGNAAFIGSSPGFVVLSGLSAPSGLLLNPNGTITVNPLTPSGTYTVVYQACEFGSNPLNCDKAVAIVTVLNPIVAVKDNPSVIAAGTSTTSVILNDSLNNKPAVIGTLPGNVSLTGISIPTGMSLNPDGTIKVTILTPSGTYTLGYQICEIGAVPANCDKTTASVVVLNPIDAVNDSSSNINAGGSCPSVLLNDTLSGKPALIGTVPGSVILTGTNVPAGLILNTDGTIKVDPLTPSKSYSLIYKICEAGSFPLNCDSATATVTVLNSIHAVKDSPLAIAAGGLTPSVISNDTLNGNPALIRSVPGYVDLTVVTIPSGITLNPDGTMKVNPLAPSGTYTLVYQICEIGAMPPNCDSTSATVLVLNPIDAKDDGTSVVPFAVIKSTTNATFIGNVTSNDTLSGVIVNSNNTDVTPITSGPLSIDANGQLVLAPNTLSGDYTIVYNICEVGSVPLNCDLATAYIKVIVIDAINDIADTITGITGGQSLQNVLQNDNLNTVLPTLSAVNLTQISTTNSAVTLNTSTGAINVAAGAAGGNYVLTYQICDKANPNLCDTATVSGFIESPSIAIVKSAHFNDEHPDGFAVIGETITYSFVITNTGNVPLTNITISDLLPGIVMTGNPINLAIRGTNSTEFKGVYTLTIEDLINKTVTNQATVFGSSPLNYTVKDLSSSVSNFFDDGTVLSVLGCVIEPFGAVTPNGDGYNDVFFIRGIDCYPDNSVEIFNRWGVMVFERSGYNNVDRAFKGISEGQVTVNQSEELPAGTYYYILKYKDSDLNAHEKAGYLYLNR